MSGIETDLERLCRSARAHERPSVEDRVSVREALRTRHRIAIGAGVTSAVTLSATSVAEGAVTGNATAAAAASASASASASAGALAGGGAAIGGAAKVWLAQSTLIWFASGLASGGAVAVGGHVLGGRAEAPARATADASPTGAVATGGAWPSETSARTSGPSVPNVDVDSRAGEDVVKPTASSSARPPAGAGRVSVQASRERPSASLESETHALAEVQRSLREGTPARALSLLDAHDAAFRDGELAVERRAARVLALVALGRVKEARALARRFLASHPASPLAKRLRTATGLEPAAREE
jgi:hypothetical protein